MRISNDRIVKMATVLLIGALFLLVNIGAIYAQHPTISARLKATPESYSGKCPTTIKFEGEIKVTNITRPPLKVQYKFIRSDGAFAPIETLTFEKDGIKKVSSTWTLGGPGLPTYSGWEAIKVVYPQDVESNKANFKITCEAEVKPKDLTIKISNCPQSAKSGQDLGATFQITATNHGNEPVKDVAIDIVLRKDTSCPVPATYAVYSPNFSNGVLLKGGREHVSLDPGQTLNVKLNGTNTIPADTPSGKYFLCAVIDAGDKVKEANEGNNCACCPIAVAAAAEKPVITGYRHPGNCVAKGSRFTVLGNNFGTQTNKTLSLGGHGIHVVLPIHSWTDTAIEATLPVDARIQEGQWYYTGIHQTTPAAWLSNIDKNITVCK